MGKQPEELLPVMRPYYLIYLSGVVPVALFNVFAQWAYAIQRTRMPMWIILGANVLNIAGNWVLLIYAPLGVSGAWSDRGGNFDACGASGVSGGHNICVFAFRGDYRASPWFCRGSITSSSGGSWGAHRGLWPCR